MTNRLLFVLLTSFLLTNTRLADAQQTKKAWHVGFLSSVSAKSSVHLWSAFLSGLRNLGYIVGQNVMIEPRWAEGKPDRLPDLATELVSRKVDVIVSTGGTVTALCGKKRDIQHSHRIHSRR